MYVRMSPDPSDAPALLDRKAWHVLNSIGLCSVLTRSFDYMIALRANRNCFFSPIGCVFLSNGSNGIETSRPRRHRHRHITKRQ
ncbi:hypothetical protein ANCCEY_07506 [Ancylostoma ceylanicum]|uniref:Uncharacterized protein n=1 Tax=Ancylostoma ceylanicum TaxID=53326 RepID=A0A0D6LQD0_9BILA|nr:hypothetical protein ANCCEY_07506 [Ancylostoma ceylanicum]